MCWSGQVTSLGARLVLLALHFPRLRLIWSRSLHATADLFRGLKANQEEPDPVVAAAVGVVPLTASDRSGCPCICMGPEPPPVFHLHYGHLYMGIGIDNLWSFRRQEYLMLPQNLLPRSTDVSHLV